MFKDFYDINARDGKSVKFIDPDYNLDMMPLIMQNNWELTELVTTYIKLEPKTVLEIGVAHGGTMIEWLKYAAEPSTIMGVEYSVDRVENNYEWWNTFKKPETNFSVITGRSQDPKNIQAVLDKFPDGVEFVFIDGSHSYNCAKQDFENYGPLVKSGGIIALHDIYREKEWGSEEAVPLLWQEIKHAGFLTRELRSWPTQKNTGIGIVYVE